MPVNGLTNAAQPVLGFNYGAGEYPRVKSGIRFMSVICVVYTTLIWIILLIFPRPFIHIFNSSADLLELGVPAMTVYFFGFFMMSLQFSGQSTFVALGKSKNAVFFSLFRKVVIVVPLTLLLPHVGGLGGLRRIPGGAHLQLHRRSCLLPHHDADGMAGAGRKKESGGPVTTGIFLK